MPLYLRKIFSSKKVLFLGCGLEKDRTLEILEICINENRSISHFAIVPFFLDKNKQLFFAKKLNTLGIEPIYYPEKDYKCVQQLINFISNDNIYLHAMRNYFVNNYKNCDELEQNIDVLLIILKECFYETANIHSQILDIAIFEKDFSQNIIESEKQSATIYDFCINTFCIYVELGLTINKKVIVDCFKHYFSASLSKENLTEFATKKGLVRKWNAPPKPLIFKTNLQKYELSTNINKVINELAYKSGMDFAAVQSTYNYSKSLIENYSEVIEHNDLIRILFAVGSISYQYKDSLTGTNI